MTVITEAGGALALSGDARMLIKYSTQKTNVAQAIRHIDASGTNECARVHVRLAAVCMQHSTSR